MKVKNVCSSVTLNVLKASGMFFALAMEEKRLEMFNFFYITVPFHAVISQRSSQSSKSRSWSDGLLVNLTQSGTISLT